MALAERLSNSPAASAGRSATPFGPWRTGRTRMKEKRVMVPTRCVHDWKALLADPGKHWRAGYSAMATACAWETAGGLPPEISDMFVHAKDSELRGARLVFATPEYRVPLKGGPRASQNDVFALLASRSWLICLMVEGKAREDFGPTIAQWRGKTSEKGYRMRSKDVLDNAGLLEPVPDHIRYQLLHRTASAVIEAKRLHAACAVMIVQSFVPSDKENHFRDFARFLELYGRGARKGELIFLNDVEGIHLYSGWATGKMPCECPE
jgi:hypothetical protein